jgi:hypothetical protein
MTSSLYYTAFIFFLLLTETRANFMPSTMPLSAPSTHLLRLYGPINFLYTASYCLLLSNCCELLVMLYFVGLTLRPPPRRYLR